MRRPCSFLPDGLAGDKITLRGARQGLTRTRGGQRRFALRLLQLFGSATAPMVAAAAMLAATPALSQGVLPLDGVFGNVEGCRAYETGNPVADYLLLTVDTFSSRGIGCAFEQLVSADNAVFTVKAVCSPGGAQTVQVLDHGSEGFGIIAGAGSELGPMFPCSPARVTGSLPRVRI